MIRLHFTEEDKQALNYERYHHPHPRVQRKRIRKFLSTLGFKRRKVGMVSSKADPDKQEIFKKNFWSPGSEKPRPGNGPSFLWMPLTLF